MPGGWLAIGTVALFDQVGQLNDIVQSKGGNAQIDRRVRHEGNQLVIAPAQGFRVRCLTKHLYFRHGTGFESLGQDQVDIVEIFIETFQAR